MLTVPNAMLATRHELSTPLNNLQGRLLNPFDRKQAQRAAVT